MKIDEAINGINNVIEELDFIFSPESVEVHAHDLSVLIAHRIIQIGENSIGQKFSDYSSKPTYLNTEKDSPKKLSPKGKTGRTVFAATGKKHKSTYFGGGYRGFREKIGRSTTKNFELFAYPNGLWNNFDVINVSNSGSRIVATIGGTTPEAQKKINLNSRQEGYSIIQPNEKELRIIEASMLNELFNSFDKHF